MRMGSPVVRRFRGRCQKVLPHVPEQKPALAVRNVGKFGGVFPVFGCPTRSSRQTFGTIWQTFGSIACFSASNPVISVVRLGTTARWGLPQLEARVESRPRHCCMSVVCSPVRWLHTFAAATCWCQNGKPLSLTHHPSFRCASAPSTRFHVPHHVPLLLCSGLMARTRRWASRRASSC